VLRLLTKAARRVATNSKKQSIKQKGAAEETTKGKHQWRAPRKFLIRFLKLQLHKSRPI